MHKQDYKSWLSSQQKRAQVDKNAFPGLTWRTDTGHGEMFVTINFDGNKPIQCFIHIGKEGNCTSALLEGLARMMMIAFTNNVSCKDISKQLSGIACCPFHDNGIKNLSPVDALSKIIAGIDILMEENDG